MGFWLFMFAMDLLIPLTMVVFGGRYRKTAPGEINSICGYRTLRSMRNRDTWDYAHKLLGRIWWMVGLVSLVLSIAAMLLLWGESEDAISMWGAALCIGQLLLLFLTIIPVEISLARTFDENGVRKK